MELCEWVLRDHKSIPKRSVAHSQNKDNSSMPRLWGNIQVSSFRMLLFICKSTHRLICMWLNGISTSQANITVVRKYGSIQQISHLICSGPTKSTFPLHLWVFGTKRGPHKRYHSQTMGLCQHRRLLNLHHHFLTMVVCREINTKCDFIPREGKGGGGGVVWFWVWVWVCSTCTLSLATFFPIIVDPTLYQLYQTCDKSERAATTLGTTQKFQTLQLIILQKAC